MTFEWVMLIYEGVLYLYDTDAHDSFVTHSYIIIHWVIYVWLHTSTWLIRIYSFIGSYMYDTFIRLYDWFICHICHTYITLVIYVTHIFSIRRMIHTSTWHICHTYILHKGNWLIRPHDLFICHICDTYTYDGCPPPMNLMRTVMCCRNEWVMSHEWHMNES